MTQQYDIKGMTETIKALRQNTEHLREISSGIPTIDRNAERLLANIKMLEININEVADLVE